MKSSLFRSVLVLLLVSASVLAEEKAPAYPYKPRAIRAKQAFDLSKPIIFKDDFSDGSLERWNYSEDANYRLPATTPERIKIMDAPGLPAGRKAVRFFVERAPDSFRAEVSLPHEDGFQERWYAGRILVPKEWVIERHSKGNDIVMQWHAIPGKGKATFPNLEISIGADAWFVRRSFGTALESPTRQSEKVASMQPGAWVSWVVHAKWSPREDGLVKIWKDGKVIYEKTGPNVYGDIGVEYTPYLKTGIYHPEWHLNKEAKRVVFETDKPDAKSKTIYGTDYKIGDARSSYQDIAPPVEK